MKEYGHFEDASREFVITDPATPFPWINYLGTAGFFSLISGTAGGYCFYRDAKFRRITRYRYNDVPMDSVGRYFYVKDGDTVWNPGWKPCKTPLDFYECRHGMGYTRITGEKAGLRADVLFFVPEGDNCEIHSVTLTNKSASVKSFSLWSYAEWCLWNGQTDGENFQRNLSTGEVEVHGPMLYHKTEYKERRNHFAFYGVNAQVDGFDTDRETFVGLYNGLDAPQQVMAGTSAGSIAHGWSPIASHRLDITLQPGESRRLVFVLGYVENPQDEKFAPCGATVWSPAINTARAEAMMARYSTPEQVDAAFKAVGQYWDAILGKFHLESGDERLNRMVNIWNPYQCMVTFNMSRSASFFESGIGRGMGFRDSNQDLVGFVHQIPERARERILDIAATQFPDGTCYHQYQPLTKRGNYGMGGGFGDDPLWLIFGTVAYLRETGDYSILEEPVPFDNAPGSEKSLFEHLVISFRHVVEHSGPHGLPLIGRADWNDCLNLNCFSDDPNESFQTTENNTVGSKAESMMIAGQLVFCGREFLELLGKLDGHEALKEEVAGAVDDMVEAIKKFGWDGKWFVRAYDFFGRKVGSDENEEGKIFIESQGWCTMAGIDPDMCATALDSVKERLDTPDGIVLNNPAFTRYYREYGEISTYPAGYKENAGIFCHNNPWIIIGEVVAGRADDAWEHWKKIAPAYLRDQQRHKVEPYVYCQMVAGKDAALPGEGKNSWLTGTAAWNWYTVTEWLLGVKPRYDGLLIEPCAPTGCKGYKVHRLFRDAEYDIDIKITPGGPGKAFIPYAPGKHRLTVEI